MERFFTGFLGGRLSFCELHFEKWPVSRFPSPLAGFQLLCFSLSQSHLNWH